MGTLVKIDTKTGEKEWYKPNHYPTEPDFIHPDAVREDDGVCVECFEWGIEH